MHDLCADWKLEWAQYMALSLRFSSRQHFAWPTKDAETREYTGADGNIDVPTRAFMLGESSANTTQARAQAKGQKRGTQVDSVGKDIYFDSLIPRFITHNIT